MSVGGRGAMVIEISEEDFKGIEDAAGEIKALVVRARMGTDQERKDCLQQINFKANSIINLLNNGLIDNEVELSR